MYNVKIDPKESTINPAIIEKITGYKGEMSGGVYKIVIGRSTEFEGMEMGNTMGVNTWTAFTGSDDVAMVDGDFAMLEGEVQGVVKALRENRINVVALHNHMMEETPRIMFLHFWALGKLDDLARGVKEALDTQNLK